jgi:hypothetical protein
MKTKRGVYCAYALVVLVCSLAGCGTRDLDSSRLPVALGVDGGGGTCSVDDEALSTAPIDVVDAGTVSDGSRRGKVLTTAAAPPGWADSCAGACFARKCGGYIPDFPTCKCFLGTGFRCWGRYFAYCDAAALAAGGGTCNATDCP